MCVCVCVSVCLCVCVCVSTGVHFESLSHQNTLIILISSSHHRSSPNIFHLPSYTHSLAPPHLPSPPPPPSLSSYTHPCLLHPTRSQLQLAIWDMSIDGRVHITLRLCAQRRKGWARQWEGKGTSWLRFTRGGSRSALT